MDFKEQEVGEEKDITDDGGVKKKLLAKGEGYEQPEKGDEVTVHYTGRLTDGTKFDSSVDRGDPFKFSIGKGQVIKGWDEGVASMKKGEKALLTCTAPYAYGEAGSPPTIPPNSTLEFEVELISWKSVKDLTGDGGIVKKIVVEGSGWDRPKGRDEVTVSWAAKVQGTGEAVAATGEGGAEFVLSEEGPDKLCSGLPKLVESMKKGEKALCQVSGDYCQGGAAAGRPLDLEIELVSWKSVTDVVEGAVTKKVLTEGDGYEKPNDGASITADVTVKLADGTVVAEEPGKQWTTDEEQVSEALDKAVLSMKKGEVALVTAAASHCYGEAGDASLGVPGGAALTYEVTLTDFVKEKESWDLETPGKLEMATKKKEDGNALYKAGKLERALKRYDKAVKYIEYDTNFKDDEKAQSKAIKLSCHLNKAAVSLKTKAYMDAVKDCTKALELDGSSVKGLFRRGQAYTKLEFFEEAEGDFKKALEAEPANRDVRAEYKRLKVLQKAQNQKEMKLFGNMFEKMAAMERKENKDKPADEPPAPAEPEAAEPAAAAQRGARRCAHGTPHQAYSRLPLVL